MTSQEILNQCAQIMSDRFGIVTEATVENIASNIYTIQRQAIDSTTLKGGNVKNGKCAMTGQTYYIYKNAFCNRVGSGTTTAQTRVFPIIVGSTRYRSNSFSLKNCKTTSSTAGLVYYWG